MTAIATIDWNAKANEALERADIMAGWSRHFYSISDWSSGQADSCPGHGSIRAPGYPRKIRRESRSVLLDKIIADYELKSEDVAETVELLLRPRARLATLAHHARQQA